MLSRLKPGGDAILLDNITAILISETLKIHSQPLEGNAGQCLHKQVMTTV
jgi:hypothetical protein